MAKQARDNSAQSSFDFSKFIDLGDDSETTAASDGEGFDYNALPHSRDEIVTGALGNGLAEAVDSYIRVGRLSRSEKRKLRALVQENEEIESTLKATDEAILERADGYHAIVSKILAEKDKFEGYALDDSDPYDSQVLGVDQESLGSREARIKSSDLFREIERLETYRSELNSERKSTLIELQSTGSRVDAREWLSVENLSAEKLEAIDRVQDLTKVRFSEEDEAVFDQGVEELTDYIRGKYNPLGDEDSEDFDALAEEDDYRQLHSKKDSHMSEETPLSSDGYTEEELAAIERSRQEQTASHSFAGMLAADQAVDRSSEEKSESEVSYRFDDSLPEAVQLGSGFDSEVELEVESRESTDGYDQKLTDSEKNLEYSDSEGTKHFVATVNEQSAADGASLISVWDAEGGFGSSVEGEPKTTEVTAELEKSFSDEANEPNADSEVKEFSFGGFFQQEPEEEAHEEESSSSFGGEMDSLWASLSPSNKQVDEYNTERQEVAQNAGSDDLGVSNATSYADNESDSEPFEESTTFSKEEYPEDHPDLKEAYSANSDELSFEADNSSDGNYVSSDVDSDSTDEAELAAEPTEEITPEPVAESAEDLSTELGAESVEDTDAQLGEPEEEIDWNAPVEAAANSSAADEAVWTENETSWSEDEEFADSLLAEEDPANADTDSYVSDSRDGYSQVVELQGEVAEEDLAEDIDFNDDSGSESQFTSGESALDLSIPFYGENYVRAVIFDELKEEYGISFEGVPGLEG